MVDDEWLVGERGLWAGSPAAGWRRLGPYPYGVNAVVRGDEETVVGTGHGLWQVPADPEPPWLQLHDETLTEVMDVARDAAGDVVAAGSYGVHVAAVDDIGAPGWRSLTETRVPDERFTNRLVVAGQLWLAGTEAGLLRSDDAGTTWHLDPDLRGTPVRALIRTASGWWAGSDTRGLWRSADGLAWQAVTGRGGPVDAVFSVAVDGQTLLVGGYDGIRVGGADGRWRRCGPRALIRCLVARDGLWLAGADPGGLWASTDAGRSWQRSGPFLQVRAIEAPTAGEA